MSFFSGIAIDQPGLNSLAEAKARIFIDLNGHYIEGTAWNNNGSFYCASSSFTNEQVNIISQRVSEDFRFFGINITTDSSLFLDASLAQRVRIVVKPNGYPGVGGGSLTGSFVWRHDTPAFVFSDKSGFTTKFVTGCISHESGHTLGLSPQAKCNCTCSLVSTHHAGAGNKKIGGASVMKNSYGRNLSGWNQSPTPFGYTWQQDGLSIITSRNVFTCLKDGHGNLPGETASKVVFKENGFSAGPENEGANLDVKVEILNASFDKIAEYDPGNVLNVSADISFSRGTYYLVVSGAEVTFNAEEDFQYLLSYLSGCLIKRAGGKIGSMQINIKKSPNGFSFLKIISNTQKITQWVVKV